MKKWIAILGLVVAMATFGVAQVPPITKTATVAITIAAAVDFNLSLNTTTINTYPNRTIGFVATVTAVNTFAGQVALTLSGAPSGWTVTMSPTNGTVTVDNSAPKAVNWVIVIPAGAAVGTSTLTVTATSTNYN